MEAQDLPPELENCHGNGALAASLSSVFGDAEVVAVHPEKNLIAAWYGGSGFNVYDPRGWFGLKTGREGQPNGESGEVYHFNRMGTATPEEAREALEDYGFEVVG